MSHKRFSFDVLKQRVCVFAFSAILSGCSLNFDGPNIEPQAPKKSLASVYLAPVTLNHDPLPEQSLQQIRDAYSQLLALPLDEATQKIVQYRLADLQVVLAEQQQENATPIEQGYYDQAIAQFQSILAQHPTDTDNADVMYQLAKSYDLQGQTQQSLETMQQLLAKYPQTLYRAELTFRIGEILFSRSQYQDAIAAYRQVLVEGSQSDYYMTAAYMLGWSHFKVEDYQSALRAFTVLLDDKLPNSVIDQQMLRQVTSEQQLERLPVGERRLVDDSIRMMARLFSYQGAELSIAQFFQQEGERHYEYLLYDRLGQQFLNEDRYRDSAQVYRAFTEVHPAHSQAPFFAVKQIDAYLLGDFPSLVLPAKQDFVDRYGINGPYWSDWGQLLQEDVRPFLKAYLQELAQYQHSKAQLLLANAAQVAQEEPEQAESMKKEAQNAFALAANRYREFIQTFPHDDLTPRTIFNLAESLFESQQYIEAIEQYEIYAYQYLQEPDAAEAGYAAILAYRAHIAQLQNQSQIAPQEQHSWLLKQLQSQAYFVSRFTTDPRAKDVAYTTMQQWFELQDYYQAIESAYQIIDWQPQLSLEKRIAANLVIAHSQFALEQYQQAEQSYGALLLMLPKQDLREADLVERLAASIYKQAEQNLAKQYVSLAIDDFLRIIEKAPQSSARVNAQYDAATYLLELGQWQQASELLEDFRVRFANHPLNQGIEDKLIHAYQSSERWEPAAKELKALWQQQPETQRGREALYIAADYFLRAGKRQEALESYRSYAHAYPKPFAEATEARFQMSEFYLQSSEDAKRRFWLKKLIQGDADAGDDRTERSRYLAAMSSMVFADDAVAAFDKIKLKLPLKSTLKKKRQALELAMARLKNTLEYKIAEFSTAANYKIAQVYAQLASDLMASERPKGLNELELEQYDILLEEQAFPFEEQAIGVHEANIQATDKGIYDSWVKQSFQALSQLLPGRYDKVERQQESVDEIY